MHLRKFADKSLRDATGASERVSTPLPLGALDGLTVEFLGRVEHDRGLTAKIDDDEAFAEDLEAGRNAEEIREVLISLIP